MAAVNSVWCDLKTDMIFRISTFYLVQCPIFNALSQFGEELLHCSASQISGACKKFLIILLLTYDVMSILYEPLSSASNDNISQIYGFSAVIYASMIALSGILTQVRIGLPTMKLCINAKLRKVLSHSGNPKLILSINKQWNIA